MLGGPPEVNATAYVNAPETLINPYPDCPQSGALSDGFWPTRIAPTATEERRISPPERGVVPDHDLTAINGTTACMPHRGRVHRRDANGGVGPRVATRMSASAATAEPDGARSRTRPVPCPSRVRSAAGRSHGPRATGKGHGNGSMGNGFAFVRRAVSNARRRRCQAGGKIFPGLSSPSGSKTALMRRSSATTASPCS